MSNEMEIEKLKLIIANALFDDGIAAGIRREEERERCMDGYLLNAEAVIAAIRPYLRPSIEQPDEKPTISDGDKLTDDAALRGGIGYWLRQFHAACAHGVMNPASFREIETGILLLFHRWFPEREAVNLDSAAKAIEKAIIPISIEIVSAGDNTGCSLAGDVTGGYVSQIENKEEVFLKAAVACADDWGLQWRRG